MTVWNKSEWRRWARGVRAGLDMPPLSREVVYQLEQWPPYKQAEHVLSYLAFGSELSLSRLEGKHFYITRTRQDGRLTVHPLTEELERHPYGFWQPAANTPEVELERLELLLIPGLAFDIFGNRLGYGRGFYDRLLARANNIPVVGTVPAKLIVSRLPTEPHDIRMTHLVSENGVFEVGNKGL